MSERRYSVTSRGAARALVIVLFAIKIVITGWNAYAFHPRLTYDYDHHANRTLEAGLVHKRKTYDGPLYYMPAWPWARHYQGQDVRKSAGVISVMKGMQYGNAITLALFYFLWVFCLFPRLLGRWQNATLASIALLALPGYQRSAVMVHEDMLFTCLTTLTFMGWLWLERSRAIHWFQIVLQALVMGATGLTRPFAIVPVALFSLLSGRSLWHDGRRRRLPITHILGRLVALFAVTGALASAWWIARARTVVYIPSPQERANMKHRPLVDRSHYYGSFYYRALLDQPNRTYAKGVKGPTWENPKSNSFFTILYSDFWGDHWLNNSMRRSSMEREYRWTVRTRRLPRRVDQKVSDKRLILSVGLPFTVLALLRLPLGAFQILRRSLEARRVTSHLVCLAQFVGGIGIFVLWQGTSGFSPGKNSTIKLVYFLFTVVFGLVPIFCSGFRQRWSFLLALLALLVLYGSALPMATVRP